MQSVQRTQYTKHYFDQDACYVCKVLQLLKPNLTPDRSYNLELVFFISTGFGRGTVKHYTMSFITLTLNFLVYYAPCALW